MKINEEQFDPTKPVQTRDGRKAGIYSSDNKGIYPIHGWIDNDGIREVRCWCASGHTKTRLIITESMLVNIPDEPKLVPYTLETFPMWAVWMRPKGKLFRWSIGEVNKAGIIAMGSDGYQQSYKELLDNYELAGDDGIWHPAGQEETE